MTRAHCPSALMQLKEFGILLAHNILEQITVLYCAARTERVYRNASHLTIGTTHFTRLEQNRDTGRRPCECRLSEYSGFFFPAAELKLFGGESLIQARGEKADSKCISFNRAMMSSPQAETKIFWEINKRRRGGNLSEIMLSGLLVDFSWVKCGMRFGLDTRDGLAGQIGGFMGSPWRSRAGTH